MQAILITAYTEWDLLLRLVGKFDNSFNIYIHIDAKVNIPTLVKLELEKISNIRFVGQVYKVNWGGMRHVDAIMHLCDLALSDTANTYFHLISGVDYPLYPTRFLHELNNKYNYFETFSLPSSNWEGGGYNRIEYYHLLDNLDIKKEREYNRYLESLERQKRSGIKRETPSSPLYGGSTWWSLSRHCLEYIIKNSCSLYDSLVDTFVPEEILFPTIFQRYPNAETLVNKNLRYIDWTYRNGNAPAVLDMSDLIAMMQGPFLFARKFSHHSEKILDKIDDWQKNIQLSDFKQEFITIDHM